MTFIHRLSLVCALVMVTSFSLHEAQAADASQSIAMLDCTLIDDNAAYNDDEINHIQKQRLSMVSDALRADLRERAPLQYHPPR